MSPRQNPGLWQTWWLGENGFGQEVNRGQVLKMPVVRVKQGVDKPKPAGKSKPRVKLTGVLPASGTVELQYTDEAWDVTQSYLDQISPGGPSNGGPFEVDHPEFARKGVRYLVIEEVGETKEIASSPFAWSTTLTWVEAEPPRKGTGAQGTKTAKNPQPVTLADNTVSGTIDPNAVIFAGNSASGFAGDRAPSTAPFARAGGSA